MASSVNYLSQIATSTEYPSKTLQNLTGRTMKNWVILKWNGIFSHTCYLHAAREIDLGGGHQCSWHFWKHISTSEAIVELKSFPDAFSSHINTTEECILQKDRLSSSNQRFGKPSAQHMLVLCIIRHQDVEAFMKSQFPHRVTCQACARTHTLVKPPAAHEKIDGTEDTHSN